MKDCRYCDKKFETTEQEKVYCSSDCRVIAAQYVKKYRKTLIGKKIRKKESANYYKKHKKEMLNKQKEYKKRFLAKPQNKIACVLRNRINTALKGIRKSKSTELLLGCSFAFLKTYLESKFSFGMTWENHNLQGWHIDHIIPCSSFDLTYSEEQAKCFHYTNLQPLWAADNLIKSNNIIYFNKSLDFTNKMWYT